MEHEENDLKKTALFLVNPGEQKVVSLSEDVSNSLSLRLFSVTTDQPLYWPNEAVFLKILAPCQASREVLVRLERKDASPLVIGPVRLDEGGLLAERLLEGGDRPVEVGEYRVEVQGLNGERLGSTTFSVVEGALGAVSFAHDFEALSDPDQLEKVNAGWFLGNATGAGLRWGNGLNVKNEIRVFNEPYSGPVTVISRCYLPGCDGIEAGPPVNLDLKNGQLSLVLQVRGHSGPFEIEVITQQGTVRHLFGRSGHIERQMVPVSLGFTRNYSATLAPYEGTREVYGRGVFIGETEPDDDPWELSSIVVSSSEKTEILIKRPVSQARLFVHTANPAGGFEAREILLSPDLKPGMSVSFPVTPPYSLVVAGGFEADGTFVEGWALVFPEVNLEGLLEVSEEGGPGQTVDVEIFTRDRRTGDGLPVSGILEVFDTRVSSTSPRDPLVSTLGDSFRNLSNSITTWRDWTGIEDVLDRDVSYLAEEPAPAHMSLSMSAPLPTGESLPSEVIPVRSETGKEMEPQETIREGEKKVVFCAVVRTGPEGHLVVPVTLPPQTGRVTLRLVLLEGFESLDVSTGLDVTLDSYLEADTPELIDPASRVLSRLMVVNGGEEPLIVRVEGPDAYREVLATVEPGIHEIEWETTGMRTGEIHFVLVDSSGTILDRRVKTIRHPGNWPVTYSDILISSGEDISIEPGNRVTFYAQPAALFRGLTSEAVTVMYSWFGHAEALSASCAIRATLLQAFEKGLVSDDGLRDLIRSDLVKTVKHLREAFYRSDSGLVSPYPGLEESLTWSVWVLNSLTSTLNVLEGSKELKTEFFSTIENLREMQGRIDEALRLQGVLPEIGSFDLATRESVLPVEIDGKVVYRAVTDDAVIRWYTETLWPILDIPRLENGQDLNRRWITACDQYRFLRAFERTGVYYPLLLHAQGLYQRGDDRFFPLFQTLSRSLVLIRDPGLVRGPALLGGVYGAPQTLVQYLDLLLALAQDDHITQQPVVKIREGSGEGRSVVLGELPLTLDAHQEVLTIQAPPLVTVRIDREKTVSLAEGGTGPVSFRVYLNRIHFQMGEEAMCFIELDTAHDPAEHYAIIALPASLSARQTGDLLSDYRGTLISGQRTSGGNRIQLLSVPFRGSHRMIIPVEAVFRGESTGSVLVRHIGNPDLTTTIQIPLVEVK